MCGIVGYVGPENALPMILDGLAHLEYRGYDSAGVALHTEQGVQVVKCAGRVADLVAAAEAAGVRGTVGIGHTRWATHGAPTTRNAHPHTDDQERVTVVHNGIIENHAGLRRELEAAGHRFSSDTDTEVVAHLVADALRETHDLATAVRVALRRLEGAFALAFVAADQPDVIVAARKESPLVVGVGDGASYLGSDIPAFLAHTRDVLVLDDGQVAVLRADGVVVTDLDGRDVTPPKRTITWDMAAAEKAGYADFMLKEIHEQPTALRDTLAGRIDDMGRLSLDVDFDPLFLERMDKVFIVACGTSFHAGLVAKYAVEHWSRVPAEIDIASEFRYRDPVLDENTLVIGISQSGETADTIAACRYAAKQGATVLAVTNVVDSQLARDADEVLYTRAGPEIGVAATKTYTAQVAALLLASLAIAEAKGRTDAATLEEVARELRALPALVERTLALAGEMATAAADRAEVRDWFFLGRGVGYPVAMEGALKLKEISYRRAEAFAAGEMKHGPIALIEAGVVVVGVATRSHVLAKMLSNLQEMRARAGEIWVVASEGDDGVDEVADRVFRVPPASEFVTPILATVPLQLLAYEVAKASGLDVDKPRNLAKTVTVE